MLPRGTLRTVAHMEIVIHVPQAVVQERVLGLDVSERGVDAREDVRRVAHALHTTCDHDGSVAELDALAGKHDRLHATRADLVDCSSLGGGGHPRSEDDLTSRGLAQSSRDDIAKVNFLDGLGGDIGRSKCALDSSDTQLGSSEALERALEIRLINKRRDNTLLSSDLNIPWNAPTGVRTAETITTSLGEVKDA